jgi:hypothetical protein
MKAPLKPKGSFHEAILVAVVDFWVGKYRKCIALLEMFVS